MKWTHEQLENIPVTVKARNPHIFKPVGGLEDPKREHVPIQTLERGPETRQSSKSRVAIVVTILSVRNRKIDDDNLIAGAKPLRDSISRSLAIDDGDPRIKWEYRCLVTASKPGTIAIVTAYQQL